MVEKKKTPTKVKQRKNRLTGETLGPAGSSADSQIIDAIKGAIKSVPGAYSNAYGDPYNNLIRVLQVTLIRVLRDSYKSLARVL